MNWITPVRRIRASEESRARLCLHVLQGDSGPSVLCEWNLRRVTSGTIYGHRRGVIAAEKPTHCYDWTVAPPPVLPSQNHTAVCSIQLLLTVCPPAAPCSHFQLPLCVQRTPLDI